MSPFAFLWICLPLPTLCGWHVANFWEEPTSCSGYRWYMSQTDDSSGRCGKTTSRGNNGLDSEIHKVSKWDKNDLWPAMKKRPWIPVFISYQLNLRYSAHIWELVSGHGHKEVSDYLLRLFPYASIKYARGRGLKETTKEQTLYIVRKCHS